MSQEFVEALKILSKITPDQRVAILKLLTEDSLIEKLQKELVQIEPARSTKNIDTITKDFRVVKSDNNTQRRTPVKAAENKWKDDGSNKDPDFSPDKFQKSPRERKPVKKIKLKCSVCSKEFEANPNLIYGEHHRCDNCLGVKYGS